MPVPATSMPMAMKSDRVQFTSFVNCMAMSGMIRMTAVAIAKKRMGLAFIVAFMIFYFEF